MDSGMPKMAKTRTNGADMNMNKVHAGPKYFIVSSPCDGNSSDEMDTDLDMEDEEEIRRAKEKRRIMARASLDSGQQCYEDACTVFGILPITLVTRQLPGPGLQLQHVGLNANDAHALACALKHNTRVESVDLEDNGLYEESMAYIIAIFNHNIYITSLSLSDNRIGISEAIALSTMLQEARWLTRLNLSGTHIGDNEAVHIAAGIRINKSVVWLDLSHNQMSNGGPKQFRRALSENKSLEFLDLSWNHIRRVGAVAICKALQVNKNLLNVNLGWNGLGYEGSIAIEEAMRQNQTLKALDISNNRINWEGILHIVRGMRANNTLQILKMGNNPVSMDGVVELLRAVLRTSSAVIHLGLEDIPVNTRVVELAEEVAQKRQFTLTHGGLIESTDMIGIRRERKQDSLMLLIRYLNMAGIRIIELFRMLDSDSHAKVSKESFVRGLKKVNAPLTESEMKDVAARLVRKGGGYISYSLLASGIRHQKREEKKLDLKQEMLERKKREERKRILKSDLPLVSSPSVAAVQEMMALMDTDYVQQRRSSSQLSRRGSVMSDLLSVTPTSLPRLETEPKTSPKTARESVIITTNDGQFLPQLPTRSLSVRHYKQKTSAGLFRHPE